MTIAELERGRRGRITAVRERSSVVHRLMEMGLLPGAMVEVLKIAPFGDPLELRVRGYALSIRKREAACFEVELQP